MAKKKIIFQGEPGANSHLACREAYPDHEPVPCPTFEDCFSALTSGDVDLGMIPIENSVAGRVADIHHLMPTAKLHIIAEWFLPIRNQLMAPKGATLEDHQVGGKPRDGARPVPQDHPRIETQADRRRRHRRLRARSGREQGHHARGHRLAAGGGNLRPRHPEGERRGRNQFDHALHRARRARRNGPSRGNGKVITTFVFRVRNVPAALYKAMGGFATNGVNMTKLESYMVGGNFFATQFYADVEGHPDDRALVFALEELAFFSKELTVLGVYPAHAFRDTFKEEKD